MPTSDADVKELEAHLQAVREAIARARTALKEASSAERILTARIAELSTSSELGDTGAGPTIEEPTILTTDHALRRTRKETLFIALAGAGTALAAAAFTVAVVVALRPREVPQPVPAPVAIPQPMATVIVPEPEEPSPPPPPAAPLPTDIAPPAATVAAPLAPPKLEPPTTLGASLKPSATDDCTTRYYYDHNGTKRYKAHCLGF